MKLSNRQKIFLTALSVFGLLLSLPLSASAMQQTSSEAKTYRVTEYQLTQLETKLNRLETTNEQLAKNSKMLKAQLATSQAALKEAQQQSALLEEQLKALTLQSKNNECLLENANKYLEIYAQEQKRTQRRIRQQRNFAWIIAGCISVYVVKHK